MNDALIELFRRLGAGEIEPPREPPLFSWRKQLEDADAIIAEVKKPVPTRIGSRRREPSPGVDIAHHRENLAQFLSDLAESYECARLDHKMRTDPDKPKRRLEDNWTDEPEPQYDYGEDAGLGIDIAWPEHYEENYAIDKRNTGGNRTPTQRQDKRPPVGPLRHVYPAIEAWWKDATGGGFSPTFAKEGNKSEVAEPFERNNPPARFLILVMQFLNKRFAVANARGVVDTVWDQRKKRKKRRAP